MTSTLRPLRLLLSGGGLLRRGTWTVRVECRRGCHPTKGQGGVRCRQRRVPRHRRRRQHLGHGRRLPVRLEEDVGRRGIHCRRTFHRRRRRGASQGCPHDSPEPRCRFRVRRRGAARGWPDFAAVPARRGRRDSGDQTGGQERPQRAGTNSHRAARKQLHHAGREARRTTHHYRTRHRDAAGSRLRGSCRLLARRQRTRDRRVFQCQPAGSASRAPAPAALSQQGLDLRSARQIH